ncbi:DNA polymerase I [Candidatus Saccharibacteria bacterium]|nr:DNA polymerase I [Candidatus Saccharibacteria bacterium]
MAGEKKKLAIIDGKSVFYRGYYAMPNLSTREGVPTGGVYGFTAMALELIKKLKPDYVAVAWDKPKTNIRKRVEMYPEYKAGRKPAPPDFYTQIPILHQLLGAFGWPLYELDDYEADDIMGTLAVQAEKKGLETLLITSDLDMLQLINHDVKVFALKRGFSNIEEFHPESFEKKYGIKAEQFLDLKALKGDSSDNIPGVPGIGEKTALELLKSYGTLDGVYKNLPLVKQSVQKKLETGKDLAYLSKKIAAIWCDAPIKIDLRAMDTKKMDPEQLRNLLQQLEFRSLLNSLPDYMKTASVPSEAIVGGVKLKVAKNILIEQDNDLRSLKFKANDLLFIHSRAAGRHGTNPLVLIIGTSEVVYLLDLTKLNKKKVAEALNFLLTPKNLFVGYDVKSDIKLLKNLGVEVREVEHDVLVAAFLINALLRVQTITELATSSLRYDGEAFENIPTEDFIARGPEIVAVIRELYRGQKKALAEMPKVEKLAREIEWPLTPVLADMEFVGIKLDTDYLKKFSKQLEGTISDIEQKIYGHANHEFNISSPAQLADVLFGKLQLPSTNIKKGKTGFSTAAPELDKLRRLHPIINLITQYREVVKLKNTYVDTLPEVVDENSRVHTSFNLTIAPTGRLSSADPNLQNIPVRTELGKRIRTAFVAEKGNMLISADYSQFELRLAAVLSGEQSMIDAFNQDADIHIETAALIYGIDSKDVTKQQRYSAKAVNFGIMYGQGPHGLSVGTGMEFSAAREFIKKYFEIRPKLKQYIDEVRKQADEQGFVETLLGRRRPTPDVKSSNFAVREAAYRAAVNMPLQGSAADIMKIAMIEAAGRLSKDSKILLQIHDSLLLEAPKKDTEQVGRILKETMEAAYKLPVKLKADISIGQNWGEL